MSSAASDLLLSERDEGCPAAALRRVSDTQKVYGDVGCRWSWLNASLEVAGIILALASCAMLLLDLFGLKPDNWRTMVIVSLGLNAASIAIRTARSVRSEGRAALYRVTTRMLSRLWRRLQNDTGMTAEMLSLEAEKGLHEVSELVDPTLEIIIVSLSEELP